VESFAFLNRLLDEYDRLAATGALRSLTMRDVAAEVTGSTGSTGSDRADQPVERAADHG
jgi:hypothetical protein